MHYLKDTTWEEVFDGWRGREAHDPDWIKCATEVKGWPDWESWRRFTAMQLQTEKRVWKIFELDQPMDEIPSMLVGPYGGWQSRYPNQNNFTFSDLLENPEQYEFWQKHGKIQSMIANFPSPTEFIGLIRMDTGKIVCLEGHHRATAVALAKKQGQDVGFKGQSQDASVKNPRIALAELPSEEISILHAVLKRGSIKNPPA